MIDHVDHALRTAQNAVVGRHPIADRGVQGLTQAYALSWIYVRTARMRLRHAAPLYPGRLYWVDPDEIQRSVSWTQISAHRKEDEHARFRAPNYRLAGRVFGGDWDQREVWFAQSTLFQSFRKHFRDGVPWDQTAFYTESKAALKEGATLWGCETLTAFDERCAEIERLYEQIGTDGYKTQTELHGRAHLSPTLDRLYRAIWGEIAVSIGRDGELVFVDGRNRLAIAKLHGLDAVPVVVLVRHSEWQQRRNAVARRAVTPASLAAEIRTHPDIEQLY